MNHSKRRWLLASVVLGLLLIAVRSLPLWTATPGYLAQLRESLLHLVEEAERREARAVQKGDFGSAEVHLHGLLSLSESLDLARSEYQITDLSQVEPQRIMAAYDSARRLAHDRESRTRLWNLEERYDDQLRVLLQARSGVGRRPGSDRL